MTHSSSERVRIAAELEALIPQMEEDAQCHRSWGSPAAQADMAKPSEKPLADWVGDAERHRHWAEFYERVAATMRSAAAALRPTADVCETPSPGGTDGAPGSGRGGRDEESWPSAAAVHAALAVWYDSPNPHMGHAKMLLAVGAALDADMVRETVAALRAGDVP